MLASNKAIQSVIARRAQRTLRDDEKFALRQIAVKRERVSGSQLPALMCNIY
jgi:SOS response regulatory protein OraA/RecX